MRNFLETLLRGLVIGDSQLLIRFIPLTVTVGLIGILYNFSFFHGLSDAQSMDNAQLARQIVRGEGFTTKFLRPHALTQLHDYATSQSLTTGGSAELFPADLFSKGTPRILPDTYNAPGYPCLLAAWFYLVRPHFDLSVADMGAHRIYPAERWILLLNQLFMLLTALLIYVLGRRLFDDRVAWMSLACFFASDLVWKFALTGLSTTVLMFLVTGLLLCVLEIFAVGEACSENRESSFGPAWLWALLLSLLLAMACLTRLPLLILLVPLAALLILMPKANPMLLVLTALVVGGAVTPWFWHIDKVSGSLLGSNTPLLLYGEEDYKGNQIYCTTSIPSYEQVFKDAGKKEYRGFVWHFEHAWNLLGSNPMVLMFGASLLHRFKRRQTQMFHWFVTGCAVCVIAVNNLGESAPETLGPWNTLVLFLPCMLVVGSAFFFVLLDRLNAPFRLLYNSIVIVTLALTALPLTLTVTTFSNVYYSFPPYMPPLIRLVSQFAQPDEWVTSDMPWATAWYGDRASLWLPDSVADFEDIHDNINPTGILLLTPVTWAQPASTLTTGENKDWLSIAVGANPPAAFPFQAHIVTPPGGPDYNIWSDRPRWENH